MPTLRVSSRNAVTSASPTNDMFPHTLPFVPTFRSRFCSSYCRPWAFVPGSFDGRVHDARERIPSERDDEDDERNRK